VNSPEALAARAQKRAAAAQVGIDENLIHDVVHHFYERVRNDSILGPIFAQRIAQWPPHLEHMEQFWRSVLLNTGEFHGNPMLKHVTIPRLGKPEFDQWLLLFDDVLRQFASPQAQTIIGDAARSIARSLLSGIQRYALPGDIHKED